MDIQKENHLMKKMSGVFLLQLMSLSFFLFGLFFFFKELNYVSQEENPVFTFGSEEEEQNTKENDGEVKRKRIGWFQQQYKHIYLFFDKSQTHNPGFYKQLNFTCDLQEVQSSIKCQKRIKIESEPLCFEEQKISAMTTGSYPDILEHLYIHSFERKDSVIQQMNLFEKKGVIFGNAKNWKEIFPFYFNETNSKESAEMVSVLQHVWENGIEFAVGEYLEKSQLLKDLQDLLDNLDHTKKTLVLLYEEQPCSIFQDRHNLLTAFSTQGFQNYLKAKQIHEVNQYSKQIDFASTISTLLNLPLPYENFGLPILDLYSADMTPLIDFRNDKELSYIYTLAYQYLMVFEGLNRYLQSFEQKYGFYFSRARVEQIQKYCDQYNKDFVKLEEFIYEYQEKEIENDKKRQVALKTAVQMIKNSQKHFLEARKLVEQNNFGPIYILMFGFIGFVFTFLIFTMLMTTFESVFGFIRNNLSAVFQFTKIFSYEFVHFITSTAATVLFLLGGVYSRLRFEIEGNMLSHCLTVYFALSFLLTCCQRDINFYKKMYSLLYLGSTVFGVFLLSTNKQFVSVFALLWIVLLSGIMLRILIQIEVLSKLYDNKKGVSGYKYYCILLCSNIILSNFYYSDVSANYFIPNIVATIFFFNIGIYAMLFGKGPYYSQFYFIEFC